MNKVSKSVSRALVGLGVTVLAATLALAQSPAKGGMVIAYKDDLATLDPQVGYDWQNWPAIKMVFDAIY